MSLNLNDRQQIYNLLVNTVEDKLRTYHPETEYVPFHHRLFGVERYAMFSFIQSINTTLGTSIWEQIAMFLANRAGRDAQHGFNLKGIQAKGLADLAEQVIHEYRTKAVQANKENEIKRISEFLCSSGTGPRRKSKVDVRIVAPNGIFYYDIKTAKPNREGFEELKKKLIFWTAYHIQEYPNVPVFTRLGIPYNPYHPEPYTRWTLYGLFDLQGEEVLVGELFWNSVAEDNIYNDLLDVFEWAGRQLRVLIDRRFPTA